ncbi:ABC transporter permease [Chitinophaga arvensicola]|uniref:ABC-2 type transport system permease protein n=1 Tax=Chitinophaga arvensicola TaxID=29529 RepID=A0A1I0S6M9_9BACT|nr:ABC transporter permease [Chitinophaga arvensicola]SEW51195.1 ABC-2 type transport system permease protein [Chitinophaga arvensicola]
MIVLGYILKKEFKQIFRDKTIIAMMFAMPTIQLIILPLAMNFDVKHVNLAVVDHDHSSYSRQLISKIGASGYFNIVAAEPSFQQAITYIEKEKADLVLEIPADFESNLVREGTQKLGVTVDAINGTKAAIGGNYLLSVINDFNQQIPVNAGRNMPSGAIDITYSNWFNPLAEYRFYVVPAVLVLLLTLIGGFMSALNIVREKEVGTIEQINVTPIRKWEFILGKLIPFWVVGMIVFTLGLGVAWGVYGIWPVGSFVTMYVFAAIYLVALLGFGLLISTYTSNQLQAMFVAFFFIMIFMLMSGLFTAVDSMPPWAKLIANLTPVTHFIKVIRMIVLKGSGFADVQKELVYLLLFAAGLNGWAIFNYRKTS